jgi:hypothetical protein
VVVPNSFRFSTPKTTATDCVAALSDRPQRYGSSVPDEVYDDEDEDLDELPDGPNNANAARIGKAVEHLVAASAILASGAELNVSTSLVDDEGVDLVFHRRGGVATLAVQVKARTTASKRVASGGFQATVRSQTFKSRPDLYMLFVIADVTTGTYDQAWLVPSADFELRAPLDSKSRMKFVASAKVNTKDKWAPYKVTRVDLPSRVLDVLAQLDKEGL